MNLIQSAKHVVPKKVLKIAKKTVNSIRSTYLSGSDLTCPFCNGSFRHMLPFGLTSPVLVEKEVIGGGYRDNCICPKCNSSDRERLIYLYLKNKTKLLNKRISVLHIAPENNLGRILKDNKNNYLSGDLDPSVAMMKMDITNLPLKDNQYNLLICNHVLEHVPDDRKAMCEIFRVLKPGGIAILQVPVSRIMNKSVENFNLKSDDERIRYFGQKDHVRIYAANDYLARLTQSGFQVYEFDWTKHSAFDPEKNKYSLNPLEKIFIAKKPSGLNQVFRNLRRKWKPA
jgi:SAM-dependent methyltransferase